MIDSFRTFLAERTNAKVGTTYKIAGGETGPNASVRYKKTASGWEVSQDSGDTWKTATDDHPSPLYNTQDIDMELEIGSLVKAR